MSPRPSGRHPLPGGRFDWQAAVAAQAEVAAAVVERWSGGEPRTVAGVDVGLRDGLARAAISVHSWPDLELLTIAQAKRELCFPYIPGLLAFRELPVLLEAFARLELRPDPRRAGVACHLGVELDLPAIGVGKSRLVGEHREPGWRRGSSTRLLDRGQLVGRVLRTRDGVRPLYISVGHRIDLDRAARFALRCARRFRLPEPIRAAHLAAGSRSARAAGAEEACGSVQPQSGSARIPLALTGEDPA
jgi:deoxyribonuclease V